MRPDGVGTAIRAGVTWAVALMVVACGSADTAPPALGQATSTVGTTTAAPPVTSTTAPPGDTTGTSLDGGRVEHPSGFEFDYPEGWVEAGATIATEFAAGAECAAAKIVDFEPPTDTGQGQAGFVLHSVVQVCAVPVDDETLDEFMAAVYPETISSFEVTEIGGRQAYRIVDGLGELAFAQNDSYRFQLVTTVVADPELEAIRIEQVDGILETLSFG
jgi:hypothetical protein